MTSLWDNYCRSMTNVWDTHSLTMGGCGAMVQESDGGHYKKPYAARWFRLVVHGLVEAMQADGMPIMEVS